MRSARSKTTTACPARVSCWAAASPAGPEPTIATFFPVLVPARWGASDSGAGRPLGGLELDLLDQHRLGDDPEHARALARRRA